MHACGIGTCDTDLLQNVLHQNSEQKGEESANVYASSLVITQIWECFMTPTKLPLFWIVSKETKTKVVSFHFHKSIKDLNISFYQKQGIKEPLSRKARKDCVLFRVLNVLSPTILDEIEIDKKLSIDFDKQQHYRFEIWKLSTRYKESPHAHLKIWREVHVKVTYVDITKASLTYIDRIVLNTKKTCKGSFNCTKLKSLIQEKMPSSVFFQHCEIGTFKRRVKRFLMSNFKRCATSLLMSNFKSRMNRLLMDSS